jgi:hypothetical protein
VLEEQAGGGAWRSSLSWDVEFLVEFREPSTWGDAPRGGRAKNKDEGEGNVNGDGGSNGGEGEEGHDIGGVSGGGGHQ